MVTEAGTTTLTLSLPRLMVVEVGWAVESVIVEEMVLPPTLDCGLVEKDEMLTEA
jgi:hypothetical protein